MALDLSKPPFGGKPLDQEIRGNFNTLKTLFDGDALALSSIAADVSGLDTEISDLASLLSESYYTSSETDNLLDAKVSASILTTVGDLLTKGGGGLQRLAAGAVGTVLAGKGAGVLPEWTDVGFFNKVDFGTFSRTKDAASGTVDVACDFEPDIVLFIADKSTGNYSMQRHMAIGVDNGSSSICLTGMLNNSYSGLTTSYSICFDYGVNYQVANITAKDSDSFTLSWTKGGVGVPNDIAGIWIAFGGFRQQSSSSSESSSSSSGA